MGCCFSHSPKLEPLIRVKDDPKFILGKNYRQIRYKYTCEECGTNNFTNIKTEKMQKETLDVNTNDNKTTIIYNAIWYLVLIIFFTCILKYIYE